MFNCDMLYNFDNTYTVDDFYDLLEKNHITGFRGPFNIGLNLVGDLLYGDYVNGISNPFAYVIEGMSARVLLEVRKSALLRLPRDFFENHPDDSVESIKAYRSKYLLPFLEDYNDENWQFWWAFHLFTPKRFRDVTDFRYEGYLEDGDVSVDNFRNPARVWAEKLIYQGPFAKYKPKW